ncbi:hypothetical protein BDA96_05G125400 [Sorghum bicolor]|uniref:Uncharacterized protein n=1 Tax=Sorghum bicolor TaxID=4558 RepID=A0A921QXS3_SORBI|nr:hypothetical protein BDA96_05G125400 [Sorghum bicolor]KAG0529760.1 hypothetical protein BDA96_05G125400 [Sorghum bicolor]
MKPYTLPSHSKSSPSLSWLSSSLFLYWICEEERVSGSSGARGALS